MRVAILDILSDTLLGGRVGRVYGIYFRKQFMAITPQAIAVWCGRSATRCTMPLIGARSIR